MPDSCHFTFDGSMCWESAFRQRNGSQKPSYAFLVPLRTAFLPSSCPSIVPSSSCSSTGGTTPSGNTTSARFARSVSLPSDLLFPTIASYRSPSSGSTSSIQSSSTTSTSVGSGSVLRRSMAREVDPNAIHEGIRFPFPCSDRSKGKLGPLVDGIGIHGIAGCLRSAAHHDGRDRR